MADTVTTTTDPADQLLRLSAATRHTALDLHPDLGATSRLPELLDTIWDLQGVLDGLVDELLDQALPQQAVRLRLTQHWARDRQVRACGTGPTRREPASSGEHDC